MQDIYILVYNNVAFNIKSVHDTIWKRLSVVAFRLEYLQIDWFHTHETNY